MFTDSRG